MEYITEHPLKTIYLDEHSIDTFLLSRHEHDVKVTANLSRK